MLMKKIIVGLLIALVVVVVLAVLAVGLFLDKAIKSGVETFGPKLTKVDVTLDSVSLSLFSGSGTIKGLVVGNPQGFKSPSAIKVGTASLSLEPRSLLSDKIVVKSINVQGPEITFETNLRTTTSRRFWPTCRRPPAAGARSQPNRPAQEPAQPKEAKPAKKLEVDDFVITGGKIHVSRDRAGRAIGDNPAARHSPAGLGTGPEGITPGNWRKGPGGHREGRHPGRGRSRH